MSTLVSAGHRLRRFAVQRDGIAVVEFALIAPILILVVIAALDFGYAFSMKLRLINATTAAAHFALSKGQSVTTGNLPTFLAKVKSIVVTTAALPMEPTVTVLFNNSAGNSTLSSFYCLSGYPAVWAGTGSSSSTCGGDVTSGKFVTITVKAQARAFFVSDAFLGAVFTTKDEAIVRIQ